MNDDVRSPGSGSTPGPLSAQPPPGLGDPDPGKCFQLIFHRLVAQASLKISINAIRLDELFSTAHQMPFVIVRR